MTIRINPKADVVVIRKAIADNGGYCPCQFPKTQDTRCICKDFLEQTESSPVIVVCTPKKPNKEFLKVKK